MADRTDTVDHWLKVEMPAICRTGPPSEAIRKLPSRRVPARMPHPLSHKFCIPDAHHRQRPQAGRNESTTWSPTLQPGVFGPTSSTMPAPSCPPATGVPAKGRSPVATWSSEWQRPAATMRMSNSSWRGRVDLDLGDLPLPRLVVQHRCLALHLILRISPIDRVARAIQSA